MVQSLKFRLVISWPKDCMQTKKSIEDYDEDSDSIQSWFSLSIDMSILLQAAVSKQQLKQV